MMREDSEGGREKERRWRLEREGGRWDMSWREGLLLHEGVEFLKLI